MDRLPEQYPYGIRVEWLDNNQIAVISTEGNMSRDAVDTWADVTLQTINNYPGNRGYFLFDMTGRDQTYTPYGVWRTEKLVKSIPPEKHGYAAIVLKQHQDLLSRHLLDVIEAIVRIRSRQIKTKFFVYQDEALEWLRGQIDNDNTGGV
ncbi:MAG: hypothetical protein SF029_21750 [bacterium]|nr:hypothetical protein [bacterium]